ncbi:MULTISPECIES: ABC transporter permease subunit [Streptomyces]|uniref:ABC transporter permease n=1 Tax=Streptomyces tsukubensis (strain DSM 42081 / NBRC 108919 / NRRL 18488 / 9993) TaxID=1114943 RepID=I2N1C5_STRT9|nr:MULTISPECIES: ABC transporter permease subunit [Streptomyces]AZK94988.1 ABC transporter permease [Streptomyces tsukubensis]EIF90822.1 putative ABC transporter permease [Streptomyces tsukubensis NRRL18488]MYS64845.1 ABC transporter permease subunit [Streptomyces sp. SID5473]QKM68944.1 ABC transporter permease [Streptomyces tsukubensis NRRL18488]TAI40843.1 ABC transporter permease [Streptomyces tsukubensis]
MSTAAPTAPAAAYRLTSARVLRAEWHKLWTVRSTWITLLTAVVSTIGLGVAIGATYENGGDDSDMDTVFLTLVGFQFALIALAVLGILVTAGEYSTGLVRSSLTAVPRRTPVLWAKTAVFGAVVLATTLTTAFVTFFAAQAFYADTDQAASLGDPGILRALLGSAAGLTLLAVIALGIGALVRSVPGAIGGFIALILILPSVLTMLPYDIVDDLVDYFPAESFNSLNTARPAADAAAPGEALLALVLWAAAFLVSAAALLKRRDV